mmetsp:Transcript_18365/g.51471  ORF Transcript_18365/g.51471 Transcript_18365/m.51471 type:complete len:306 (+) Transcript_18365:614-1531(+)
MPTPRSPPWKERSPPPLSPPPGRRYLLATDMKRALMLRILSALRIMLSATSSMTTSASGAARAASASQARSSSRLTSRQPSSHNCWSFSAGAACTMGACMLRLWNSSTRTPRATCAMAWLLPLLPLPGGPIIPIGPIPPGGPRRGIPGMPPLKPGPIMPPPIIPFGPMSNSLLCGMPPRKGPKSPPPPPGAFRGGGGLGGPTKRSGPGPPMPKGGPGPMSGGPPMPGGPRPPYWKSPDPPPPRWSPPRLLTRLMTDMNQAGMERICERSCASSWSRAESTALTGSEPRALRQRWSRVSGPSPWRW